MNPQFDLWELRERTGMTQGEIARRTGIDPARISRLEADSSKVTLAEWIKLTDALGVPAEHAIQDLTPEHGLFVHIDEDAYTDLRSNAQAVRDSAAETSPTNDDADLPGSKDIASLFDTVVRKPRVLITGPFDAGKSTLVNLLLGGTAAVPVRYSPTTSVVTYLRHTEDRPTWCKDEVIILGDGFDAEEWSNESRVLASTLRAGGLSILQEAGAHGEDGIADATTALVFHSAPILRTCTIVDTPGDDSDDEDSNKTFQAVQSRPIDVLIYMSALTGFLGGPQITQLDARVQSLADPGGSLAAGRNLFVVMSHAAPSRIPDDDVTEVFASAAARYERSVGADLSAIEGAASDARSREISAVLRSRMFGFYRGIGSAGSRGQDFLNDLTDLLGRTLPAIARDHATDIVADYQRKAIAQLDHAERELDELDALAEDAAPKLEQLEEQVSASAAYVTEFGDKVGASVKKHRKATLNKLPETLTKELGKDLIEKLISDRYGDKAMLERSAKDRKKGAKKLAQEEMPGLMAKRAFAAVERDLKIESEKFAEELQAAMDDLRAEFRKSNWVGKGEIPIDFDGAFIGGAMSGMAVGALALWASTLGNLGAYIIAAQAAGWLTTLGISLPAGGATLTAAMAAMGGPVGVAVAIIAVGFLIGMQFKDGWQVRLAKNISAKLQETQVKEKGVRKDGLPLLMRTSIEQYWDDTDQAVRIGAEAIHDALERQLEDWKHLLKPESQQRRIERRNRVQATRVWLTWLQTQFTTAHPRLI